MVFHEVAPRSPEWAALRLGIPCSSEFHRIITPKKREISKQADGLMFRLLAEWVTGAPVENAETEWMVRGTEMEDAAIRAYEGLMDVETSVGGFCTTDDGMVGCSPDRLVGDDGDLEIKCPLIQTQIGYALTGTVDEDYKSQLQGRLWITGRKWVDIFSYHPALLIPPVRVVRDEQYIKELEAVLKAFVAQMLDRRVILEQRFGPFVRPVVEVPIEYPEWLTAEDGERIIESQRAALKVQA